MPKYPLPEQIQLLVQHWQCYDGLVDLAPLWPNKLGHLSMGYLSHLAKYLWTRPGAYPRWEHLKDERRTIQVVSWPFNQILDQIGKAGQMQIVLLIWPRHK